ncbi:tannase/feruloyl esterase family alpha/beta hydrolase [uncultured Sulfitobacter sp.]|uniref:tannase/feruloyl esterase family alpha/beta hydrolase n=1 Tax=uncultured Sulfitobacter sp. TaxID=191468 RepID=UPI0025940162|nr:tannase/feruloyl esterase family alpha/beta hydrolase [uncultured Sulfitobacter sp.]
MTPWNTTALAAVLWTALGTAGLAQTTGGTLDCGALADLDLGPSAAITSASLVEDVEIATGTNVMGAGLFEGSGTHHDPFCRVVVSSQPARTSDALVEVWLPLETWNGRLLGVGNGGYPTSIDYRGMSGGLVRDYAVVSTDMGLASQIPEGTGDATAIFLNNPIAAVDFASRSTHEMTWIAKDIVQAFYGKAHEYAYFAGCSTGGMQGYAEAQRYPDDYQGILAGASGGNRARAHLALLWNWGTVWGKPDHALDQGQLELLHESAVSACSAEGATVSGSLLSAPQECDWSPSDLLCEEGETQACLSAEQLETVEKLYAGPTNPRTGEQYFPGLLPGSELGWPNIMGIAGAPGIPYTGIFSPVVGEEFDFTRFDWDRDAQTFIDVVGPLIDSRDPDISDFVSSGGKLLMYHGQADWLASAVDAIDYRAAVLSAAANWNADLRDQAEQSVALYLLPGMSHCAGGIGPDTFDGLATLREWRETGTMPAGMDVLSRDASSSYVACPYPAVAVDSGETCAAPQ